MKQFEKFSDAEIIEKVLQGEVGMYEIIVRRYNGYLYKIGRTYNYNHEDTEDLIQDTYVDAFKNLSKFEGRSSFKTWLVRIMLNNCYRKKEKMSYKNEFATDNPNENKMPMFSKSHNDGQREIHSRELGKIIEDAVEKIPEIYRVVFTLREMNGFNVAETAKLLEISKSNVKVRLNRAKAMLKNIVESSYAPEELFEFNLIYCDAMVDRVMDKIKETKSY